MHSYVLRYEKLILTILVVYNHSAHSYANSVKTDLTAVTTGPSQYNYITSFVRLFVIEFNIKYRAYDILNTRRSVHYTLSRTLNLDPIESNCSVETIMSCTNDLLTRRYPRTIMSALPRQQFVPELTLCWAVIPCLTISQSV